MGKYQDPKMTMSRKNFGIVITKHTYSGSRTLLSGPTQKWHPHNVLKVLYSTCMPDKTIFHLILRFKYVLPGAHKTVDKAHIKMMHLRWMAEIKMLHVDLTGISQCVVVVILLFD